MAKRRGIYKGHPADGTKRHDYVERKIAHLRRVGLVTSKTGGRGMNGGACPDHLFAEQKMRAEVATSRHARMNSHSTERERCA